MYVTAETVTEYTRDYDYKPAGNNDIVQNRLDDDATNNRDTWNPSPSGVYVGGYSLESKMRLTMVPDDDCSVSMAQVVRFDASQIMSGASYFVMRLPVAATYEYAYVDIYEISSSCNWTFSENITMWGPLEHTRNSLRVNFTSGEGNQSLVYWSSLIDPSDESPTDGDFYYTRDNRTYCQIRCPIRTDQYYLIVTTAKYVSDSYVEMYWQPESLTGAWNRSTLGTYNKIAPDTAQIVIENFNISLGYSFDFREGFGAGMCGYNKYMSANSQIKFYRRLHDVDLGQYFTFMFPFYADLTNISVRVHIVAFDFAGNYEVLIENTAEYNDFVIISTANILDTEIPGAWKAHWEGWLWIYLQFGNETRYRFYNRDLDFQDEGFNSTWIEGGDDLHYDRNAVHAPGWRYMPSHYFMWNDTALNFDIVFWQIQAYVQLNNYKWTQSGAPTDSRPVEPRSWEDMDFTEKAFYGVGKFLITMGSVATHFNPGIGYALNAAGTTLQLIAQYADLPDPFGWLSDGLNWVWNKLQTVGEWLYKVGQAIIGAISWFVDALVYYGSIILGILILVLAFIVLFLPIWASAKVAQIIVHAASGRTAVAVDEMGNMASRSTGLLKRGG